MPGIFRFNWFSVALLFVNVGLSFIPARIARKKGYSASWYWCISFFLTFVLGILFASALPSKSAVEPSETELPVPKRKFSDSYLGFVMIAALLTFALILASLSPSYFNSKLFYVFAKRMVMFGLPAIAIALTTRAKGPDLSLGGVIVFSGVIAALVFTSGGSIAASIAVALLAAALIGAITGVLTVTLRLPSILTSLAISFALYAAALVITHGEIIFVKEFSDRTLAALLPDAAVILPVVIIAAFLFVCFTRLGKPMNARRIEENRSLIHFSAYIFGGLLAGIAGVYELTQFGMMDPTEAGVSPGFIMFIFGAILSSRLLDNRWAPVLYAFGAAFLYELISIALLFLDVPSSYQTLFFSLCGFAFTAVGTFANRKAIANMLAFK